MFVEAGAGVSVNVHMGDCDGDINVCVGVDFDNGDWCSC